MHPNYQNYLKSGGPLINDIALVELESEVSFNDNMKPVCLPKSNTNFAPGKICTVTGFGRTSGGLPSTTLRKANVAIVDNRKCAQKHGYRKVLAQNVCAGNRQQGSCNGDSGGPLVCQKNGKFYLTGVVSFGNKACDDTAVYAKVAFFMDWIKQTMNFVTNNN